MIVEAKNALANMVDETTEHIFLRNKKPPAKALPKTFAKPTMSRFISRNKVC